jgi:hypothetical protein
MLTKESMLGSRFLDMAPKFPTPGLNPVTGNTTTSPILTGLANLLRSVHLTPYLTRKYRRTESVHTPGPVHSITPTGPPALGSEVISGRVASESCGDRVVEPEW